MFRFIPTEPDLTVIAAQCARECIRQHVGLKEVGQLIRAYNSAIEMHDLGDNIPNMQQIIGLSQLVEPKKGGLRKIPVVFQNGRAGTAAEEVNEAMWRLFTHIENADPHEFTRAFLNIHPFADGNGRTAFILFNWLNGTLNEPRSLPDFNWD